MDLEFDIQLEPGAKAPEKIRESDTGWDLFCYEPVQFTYSGEYIKVRTGVHITPPEGYFFQVVSRSSSMDKKKIQVLEGQIDRAYTGEIMVQVIKTQWSPLVTERLEKGEKFAQLILLPKVNATMKIVDKLQETDRGDKGFGSSGGYIDPILENGKMSETNTNLSEFIQQSRRGGQKYYVSPNIGATTAKILKAIDIQTSFFNTIKKIHQL